MNKSLNELLAEVEALLPKDEEGNFIVFSRSIPVNEAIAKGYLTREQAEAQGLKDDDPSGYDAQGKPIERSDVIHDFLALLAEQMIELNRQKQSEIKKFLAWLESELQIQPDKEGKQGLEVLTNKTKLKNFLGDYQKGQPHLEFDQLWKLLKVNEKRLSVKLSPDLHHRLSEYYRATLDKLLPIKEQLRMTDVLIDQIVYRLYGLTEQEIVIVGGRGDQGR